MTPLEQPGPDAPSPSSPARRSTATARREEIISAAVSEFAVHGLHGTSTEAIARRAGVSQPYIFRLFGTKKALFLAATQRCFDRVAVEFRAAAERARQTGEHPFDEMGLRYVEMLADREMVLLQMQAYVASSDPEVRVVVQRRYGELYRWLESMEPDRNRVHAFLSTGMFLNVAAAIDLPSIVDTDDWAGRCLDIPLPSKAISPIPATAPDLPPTEESDK